MKTIALALLVWISLGNSAQIQAQSKLPKPLKIGISVALQKATPSFLKEAKLAGIDYIELGVGHFTDTSRQFTAPDQEMMEQVVATKKAADAAGIIIWSIHMPFGKNIDLSLPNESDRLAVVDMHTRLLKFIKVLKPKVILFHPSWFLGVNERELRKQQLEKSVIALNKPVRAMGAMMVIENMLGPTLAHGKVRERPLLRTVEEAVEVMNRLPKNVYAAIDFNHIKYPEKLVLAMGKRLKSIHVADGTGLEENHFFPCSGKGENDWTAILQAMNKVGYRGPFMYESTAPKIIEYQSCYETLYRAAFKMDK